MKKRIGMAALAASLACASAPASAFTKLFAFGDSLSDAGNVFIADGGTNPAPPYFKGHASNGPTWVEDLSIKLGLGPLTPSLAGGNDFAFGGAQTGVTPIEGAKSTDLPGQVAAYAALHPTPVSGALYTMDIGANDIRSALDDYASGSISFGKVKSVVSEAEANTVGSIDELYTLGARSLLFFGVQNLGNTPRFEGTRLQSVASELAQSFDAGVLGDLGRLEAGGLKVYDMKPGALFQEVRRDPARYGFVNVTAPCWTGNFTSATSGTLCSSTLAGQDTYLYWDKAHPTEAGHLLIAEVAYDTLIATPEPPTWALLLMGFAGLGLAGWRVRHGPRSRSACGVASATRPANRRLLGSAATIPERLQGLRPRHKGGGRLSLRRARPA
jgi:phospholipase/lecithinase/hemolysin